MRKMHMKTSFLRCAFKMTRVKDVILCILWMLQHVKYFATNICCFHKSYFPKNYLKKTKFEKIVEVPPRFELGSLDSKSRVLTITPWGRSYEKMDFNDSNNF